MIPADEVRENSIARLQRSRLFAGAPPALVERCAAAFALQRIAAGATLAVGGDSHRNVHVLRHGTVRLELRAAYGTALVLGVLRDGDAFGVEALLGARPRAAFAVCCAGATVLSAPAAVLAPIVMASPVVTANVARILASELAGVETTLRHLHHARVAARVEDRLHALAVRHGVCVSGGTLLDIALDAADVAALINASPVDVEAALSVLERDGRIRVDGSLITLVAPSDAAHTVTVAQEVPSWPCVLS
jgi:CRP-like cAMP-binding protein